MSRGLVAQLDWSCKHRINTVLSTCFFVFPLVPHARVGSKRGTQGEIKLYL